MSNMAALLGQKRTMQLKFLHSLEQRRKNQAQLVQQGSKEAEYKLQELDSLLEEFAWLR